MGVLAGKASVITAGASGIGAETVRMHGRRGEAAGEADGTASA